MFNRQTYELGSKRSCIRELFEYGIKQAAVVGAENVFDYSLGNPSVPAPPEVNQSIVDILSTESSLAVHGYTTAAGLPKTRAAIAEDLNERYGLSLRAENFFMTGGAAQAIISVLRALHLDEQTEILTPAPHFAEYRPFIEGTGNRYVRVPADTATFQINLSALEKLVSPHTQAVLINSPNNPSGAIYTRENLQGLAGILKQKAAEYGHPIYVISDEPYRELVYTGEQVPFVPSIYPDTIVCYSWSKSLSLPGERIGYFLVSDQVTDAAALYAATAGAARVLGHVCASSLMQRVIERCARVRPDVEQYKENRQLLYEALTEIGYTCVPPDGAFYLMVKAPDGDGQAFSDAAKAYNLLIVPTDDFGLPGYVRLSYCVSNDMIKRSLPAFKKLRQQYL